MIEEIDPQTQNNFFTDIINSAVFNTPVPFTKKYPQITHYQTILTHQQKILSLLYQIVADQISGLQILQSIQKNVSDYKEAHLQKLIKPKYQQIKKELIKREIRMGSCFLATHNWKIKNIVASHSQTHKQKMIICLSLYTLEGSGFTETQEIINLELSIPETKQFLLKLKQVRNDMKSGKY